MDWYTLDCGHGNMTILEQNGEKLAIDAGSLNDDEGSNPFETDEGSNPLETDESVKLDDLVITHRDADHIEGIVDLYTDNDVEFGTIWIPPIFHDKRYQVDDSPELVGIEGLDDVFEDELEDDNSYIITTDKSQDIDDLLPNDNDIQFGDEYQLSDDGGSEIVCTELVGIEGLEDLFEDEIEGNNSSIIATDNSQDDIEDLFSNEDIEFHDGYQVNEDDDPELVGIEGLGDVFEGEIEFYEDENSYVITTSNGQDTIESLFPDKDIQFSDGKTELSKDELTTIQEFQLIAATSEHTVEATEGVTPEADLDVEFLGPPILRDIIQDGVPEIEDLEALEADPEAYMEDLGNATGSSIDTSDGPDPNENSVVTRVSNGEIHLFTGDIGEDAEQELLETHRESENESTTNKLSADILHAPHHGATKQPGVSGTKGNTKEFLEAVDPEVVVISTNLENQYGHPDPALFERCMDLDIRTAWTGVSGTISNEDLSKLQKQEFSPKELMKLRCIDKSHRCSAKYDLSSESQQESGGIDIAKYPLDPELETRYGYDLEKLDSILVEDDTCLEISFARPDSLTHIYGVGNSIAENLKEAGYSTVEDVAEADPDSLEEVDQIDEMAEEIIQDAECKVNLDSGQDNSLSP